MQADYGDADRVFADLTSRYAETFTNGPEQTNVQRIQAVVDTAISELDLAPRLRSDARHFLMVNAHQMLVAPLLSRPERLPNGRDDLFDALGHDARAILTAAGTTGGLITGHVLVEVIARVWDELRLPSASYCGFSTYA
jgi:hypothetical protein